MDDKVAVWVYNNDACFGIFTYHCSNCGKVCKQRVLPSGRAYFENYCSKCGSKMLGFETNDNSYDLSGMQIVEDKNG